jgi:dihydroorotate dehydrogenase
MIFRLIQPFLFRLDPERAHAVVLQLLRILGANAPLRSLLRGSIGAPSGSPVEVFGRTFPNPIGLAAGYDKDALAWRALGCLGFGHVEVGTVTPRAQPGNPRPRVFRLTAERSLINRLGFPSRGADFVVPRLRDRREGDPIVGVNIGKQRDTALDDAIADYGGLISRFAPVADYLAVNVSSPNTPELRRLQHPDRLGPLLRALVARRDDECAERSVPLLVKLSPDIDSAELDDVLGVIVEAGVDGVIATNTTTSREGLSNPRSNETGGLSGAALTTASTRFVARVHRRVRDRLPIVACGGIMGAADVRAKLAAGAKLVQIYTGLVYGGPHLVRRILEDLARGR